MKKIAKKTCAFIVAASSLLSVTACGPEVVGGLEEGKTNLSVAIYSGGYGTNWIDGAIERFEAKYENTSFADGEVGVNVIPNKDKSYTGNSLTTTVKNNDAINIYFAGEVPYRELYLDNALLDITDLVKDTKNEQDGKTIESKFSNEYKEFLSENGKYYAIPLYEAYNGITYDAGVFKSKKLYFSNKADTTASNRYPGTNAFVTGANDTKSCGPDGVFNTYDDGLPSTYQEFYKLMDKMTLNGVTPFVFSFNSTHYSNNLIISLFENYVGAEGVNAVVNYDTNGEEIEIVTGFDGNTPTVESKVLTRENANQIKQSLGMYYASEFAQKVFGNNTNYDTVNTATTHLDAMERFMKSGLDGGNYIGMLLDGNWWYNEATDDGLFKGLVETYPSTYQEKDFKFMPLPHQYAGTVTPRDESEVLTPVLLSGGTYAFISANIPQERIKAAKAFLSFCYGDEELCKATEVSNGVLRAVNYDFSSVSSTVNSYAQSVFAMREQAINNDSIVTYTSRDPIFLSNMSYFTISTISSFWKSGSYLDIYKAFHDGKLSAKDYFTGISISDTDWANSYLK